MDKALLAVANIWLKAIDQKRNYIGEDHVTDLKQLKNVTLDGVFDIADLMEACYMEGRKAYEDHV